jgi:surfeit locus 1 family protein
MTKLALAALAAVFFVGLLALGTWQVQRRAWKLDLIARVDQRVHAPAVPAPGPDRWPRINADADEYLHVRLAGHYLYDRQTLVQASTDLGSGYWVLTPLQQADQTVILVNRGFVPADQRERPRQAPPGADGNDVVTGLLRMSEPKGGFLRDNDPAAGRWYSRDVAAIAQAHGLSRVAPYFVDAAAVPGPASGDLPVGGLTAVTFHNSHLVYAITWYALALMVAGATWYTIRDERRLRRASEGNKLRANGEREDDPYRR